MHMTIIMKMKCSGRGSRSLCKERRMEEEGDIYDGVRAQFPLSFGKQSKPQTPLEAIHNATRRSNSNPKTTNDLPSISSSSRECLLVDHDFKFLVNVFQLKRYTLILPNELDAKFT